jgi:hypothetical protein
MRGTTPQRSTKMNPSLDDYLKFIEIAIDDTVASNLHRTIIPAAHRRLCRSLPDGELGVITDRQWNAIEGLVAAHMLIMKEKS